MKPELEDRSMSLKPIEQINADRENTDISPLDHIDAFLEHCTPENFDELHAKLSPKMKEHMLSHAITNRNNFDSIIAGIQERGDDPVHWVAYKEWASRQPEVQNAPPGRRGVTLGAIARAREAFSAEGWRVAELRVAKMRATTDEERARIDEEIAALEK
jgi:hypothetical protein